MMFKFWNIASQCAALAKSFMVLSSAAVVNCFKLPRSAGSVIVGSDYGNSIDPNASSIISALTQAGEEVIFISNRDSVVGAHRLNRGSLPAARAVLAAKAVLYTHSFSDVIPAGHRLSLLFKAWALPQLIFLQHGVIGLKSRLSSGVLMKDYIKSLSPSFDKMVVSSTWERSLVEQMGVARQKIAITGLPRFDSYDLNHRPTKLILVFFTWQEISREREKINQILTSKQAKKMQAVGYRFVVGEHKMQERFNASKVTKKSATSLDQLVVECDLLITDDSSVAWDVLYLGKEVLFYKPASEWLLPRERFSDRVSDSVDGLELLLQRFERGELAGLDFPVTQYVDNNNCARVLALLKQG